VTTLTRISSLIFVGSLLSAGGASAQIYEAAGPRAGGMGGAFIAVADDSSATWWNPAGQAAGPFLEVAAGRTAGTSSFAVQVPPFGVSYYRFEAVADPIADPGGNREVRRVGVPARASQWGATVVQTLVDGVHVGLTAKYVRGSVQGATPEGTADVDAGVLGVFGAVRIGAAVRNLRGPVVGGVLADRQVRVGAAFDAEAAGGPPAMFSLDVDLRAYEAPEGRRRVVAAGAERWLAGRRFGLRAGGRVNTAGQREKAVTAGAGVALRPGLYVDAYGAAGSGGEQSWGAAGRVSF
jgi:hypothetical protein